MAKVASLLRLTLPGLLLALALTAFGLSTPAPAASDCTATPAAEGCPRPHGEPPRVFKAHKPQSWKPSPAWLKAHARSAPNTEGTQGDGGSQSQGTAEQGEAAGEAPQGEDDGPEPGEEDWWCGEHSVDAFDWIDCCDYYGC